MSAFAALADLVLPRRCVGCGHATGPLCRHCLPPGRPQRAGPPAALGWAAGGYDGALRAALLAYKERGRRDLAAPLGLLLARAVGSAIEVAAGNGRVPPHGSGGLGRAGRSTSVVLVPVPSARSVAAARGGDHVRRLAARAGAVTGQRTAADVLALTRAVRDSAGLGVDERSVNLAAAMMARPVRPGLCAVVVDDIVTTGATLLEARRALLAAGWPVIGAAVVAATPRRGRVAGTPLAAPRHTV